MNPSLKKQKRMNFTGIKFLWFLAIEVILILGSTIYLVYLSKNVGLVILIMAIAILVAMILAFVGSIIAFITRLSILYFLIQAIMIYPIVSSWIDMIQEEDWLQGLVDFLVLAPLLGGIVLSLPGFLVLSKRTKNQ